MEESYGSANKQNGEIKKYEYIESSSIKWSKKESEMEEINEMRR